MGQPQRDEEPLARAVEMMFRAVMGHGHTPKAIARAHILRGSSRASRDAVPRPFRVPHTTASYQAMVGSHQWPGEVSLASGGTLVLSDLPEFFRSSLTAAWAILERGEYAYRRQGQTLLTWPARPRLVIGTMRPCLCTSLTITHCKCTPKRIAAYHARVPDWGWTKHILEATP